MRLATKDYFTLSELLSEWALRAEDAIYLAENGDLRTSVRVFGLLVERGYIEPHDIVGSVRCPCCEERINGLLDLCEKDVHLILKHGQAEVTAFHAPEHEYCWIADGGAALRVTTKDLLVRRKEKERFEATYLRERSPATPAVPFAHSDDYRRVVIDGFAFDLGFLQAKIVEVLHAAWLEGNPWLHGPTLLAQARAGSDRLVDLFKSQPNWRRLIQSDRRGHYRLALPDRPQLRRPIRE